MKRMKRVICIIFIIIGIGRIAYASELQSIDKILEDAGVGKTYRENIINYMESSDISAEELDCVIDLTKVTVGLIAGRSKITDFNISELLYIYGNIMSISESLDIKIHINFINGSLLIIDKNIGSILFEGDINNLNEYYVMYDRLISNEIFIKKLMLK